MKKVHLFTCLALVVAMVNCGGDGEVLATFKNGKVIRGDLRRMVSLYELESAAKRAQWQKNTVRQLALNRILSGLAIKEKLNEQEEVGKFLELLKANILRKLLAARWKEKQDGVPARLYKVRHILLKTKTFREVVDKSGKKTMKNLSAREQADDVEQLLGVIKALRNDIQNNRVDFGEAAVKHSEDKSTLPRKGGLGYFPAGIMVPQFDLAIKRLSGELAGAAYRVKTDGVQLYQEPNTKAQPLRKAKKYEIVVLAKKQPEVGGWHQVYYTRKDTAYVKASDLTPLEEKEKKLSLPVRTSYGWHIIDLENVREVSKEQYRDILAEQEPKLDDEQLTLKIDQYWDRIVRERQELWMLDLEKKYGIDPDNFPQLKKNWRKTEVLFDQNGIKVTSKEIADYGDAVLRQQGIGVGDLPDPIAWINDLYRRHLEGMIFVLEGKQYNLEESEDFQLRLQLERAGYLASIYRRDKWFGDINASEAEIRADYQQIAARFKSSKQKPPSFKQQSKAIRHRIRSRKQREIATRKENELLRQLTFRLQDDNFADNKI